jgi:2-polyprenyl-3-methyl-5-hydroxy-6-metoxy-1,4-benzoquinol methylase
MCLSDFYNKIEKEFIRVGGNKDYFKTYFDEFKFGFNEIISCISKNDKILEIGSGSGLLSSYLSTLGYKIKSLEPFDKGFHDLKLLHNTIKKINSKNYNVINSSLEDYETYEKFDKIFAINVFEHVDDYKFCIIKACSLLNENGELIILCPNYSFPYESHFNIPIILNKKVTYFLFENYINKHSEKYKYWNIEECWDSLNWITYRDIKKISKKEGLTLKYDKQIIIRMFERLYKDQSFMRRKPFLFKLSKFNKLIKLDNIITSFPIRFHPYLKLILSK